MSWLGIINFAMSSILSICPRGVTVCAQCPIELEAAAAFLIKEGLPPQEVVDAHLAPEHPFTAKNGWVVDNSADHLYTKMACDFKGVPQDAMTFTNTAAVKVQHEMTIKEDGRLVARGGVTYFMKEGWMVARVPAGHLDEIFVASPDGKHHSAEELAAVIGGADWSPCSSATLCWPVPRTQLEPIDLLNNGIVGRFAKGNWVTEKASQQITVELDEQGSSAEAVTTIKMCFRSMSSPPHITLDGQLSLLYAQRNGGLLMCVALA